MSRRVEGPKAKLSGENAGGESYSGRLAKYIPAEIVALYLSVKGLPPPASRASALWWIFWVCLALTPIYLVITTRKPKEGKGPQWIQVALATIAFPVWVFAIGNGPFDSWKVEAWVITLVLGGVTLLFGAIPAPPEQG